MTRADVELMLAGDGTTPGEFSDFLSLALASGGTVDAAVLTAWLDWPIGDALRTVGYPASSYGGVIDDAIAAIVAGDEGKFNALIRLRVAERLAPGLAKYLNMQQGPDKQELGGLMQSLNEIIARLSSAVAAEFPDFCRRDASDSRRLWLSVGFPDPAANLRQKHSASFPSVR